MRRNLLPWVCRNPHTIRYMLILPNAAVRVSTGRDIFEHTANRGNREIELDALHFDDLFDVGMFSMLPFSLENDHSTSQHIP